MYTFSIPVLWSIFFFFVLIIFVVDYNRQKNLKKNIYVQKISLYDFFWFFLSCLFVLIFWLFLYYEQGKNIANEQILSFVLGYFLEILLAIDNIFMWFLIFKYFRIPIIHQRKVLSYGIWGAIILRFIMIFFGSIAFLNWNWLLYCFGLFFIWTGINIFLSKNTNKEQINNIWILWIYKLFRVSKNVHTEQFFLKEDNKLYVTPLFLCLILIEFSDVVFAIDSIPAIFSITNNLFIIFTSNIFAVLGLRSMYYMSLHFIKNIFVMKYFLSCILIFIGCKILLSQWIFISTFYMFLIIIIIAIFTLTIHRFFYYTNK